MPNQKSLFAIDLARKAAVMSVRLVSPLTGRLAPVADQVVRSATSIPLNLAEGNGRLGRDRVHHYRIAYGSALETVTALQLLGDLGAVPETHLAECLAVLDSVKAITYRLINPLR
jgi:four helix bundle protein